MKQFNRYYIYILLCADNSFYTGITNDLDRRIEEHNLGENPKCYTYSRRPLALKYSEEYQNVNDAISREKQIKGWSRKKKEALMNGDYAELMQLSKNKEKRLLGPE